jgi:hypothetical protein
MAALKKLEYVDELMAESLRRPSLTRACVSTPSRSPRR